MKAEDNQKDKFMKGKLPELESPLDFLGDGERDTVETARQILRFGAPNKDEEAKLWAYKNNNIKAQEDLTCLKAMLKHTYNVKLYKFKQFEVELLEDLVEDYGSRKGKDRLALDNQWRDRSLINDTFNTLIEFVDSLIWQLKQALSSSS